MQAANGFPAYQLWPCFGLDFGAQPTVVLTHDRALALSAMGGKCRRSSTTADSSPPSFYTRRMASAVTSSTTNMPRFWACTPPHAT